jgi:DNA-binding CsgD family transcriptional regulator
MYRSRFAASLYSTGNHEDGDVSDSWSDASARRGHSLAYWPTADDFEIALVLAAQNRSGISFFDGEKLEFATDELGRLEMLQGSFGYVYEARQARKTWALKVFSRDASDRQERYSLISAHLQSVRSRVFVDFTYDDQAIPVQTTSGEPPELFPALRMAWCAGNALDVHLDAALRKGYDAERHVNAWLKLVNVLRRHGIAHGDLQHENVVVTKTGDMRLIDYDGMFVPSMDGLGACEGGHPAYQHPARSGPNPAPFDAHLDGVSALVILATLGGLTPELWNDRAEDGLILRSDDLADPGNSPVYDRLASTSRRSGQVVDLLREALANEPGPCPQLDAAARVWDSPLHGVHTPAARSTTRTTPRRARPTPTVAAAPEVPYSWIRELHAHSDSPAPAASAPVSAPAADDSPSESSPTAEPTQRASRRSRQPRKPTPAVAPLGPRDLLTLLSRNAGLSIGQLAELRNVSERSARRSVERLRNPDGTPRLTVPIALTRRQAEVLELRLAGASEDETAARLRLRPTTVRRHAADAARAIGRSRLKIAKSLATDVRELKGSAPKSGTTGARGAADVAATAVPVAEPPTVVEPKEPAPSASTPATTPPAPRVDVPPSTSFDFSRLLDQSRRPTPPTPPPRPAPSSDAWWWLAAVVVVAVVVLYLLLA